MDLGNKQRTFVRLVGRLIDHAYSLGYEMSFGDAWAKTGHKENSNHYIRLAIDLNLFKDGKWLQKTEDHKILGEWWEKLGKKIGVLTRWGGRFGDGNHYSIEHDGVS